MKATTTPTKLLLFAVAGFFLTTSAVRAEEAPPRLVLDPADLRADRVGPFTYGMPIEAAAKLCHVKLEPEQKQVYQKSLVGHNIDWEETIFCKVTVGKQDFKLSLDFVAAKLNEASLFNGENSGEITNQEDWLRQTQALLDVLRESRPGHSLQVGNYSSLSLSIGVSRRLESSTKDSLTAKSLLQKLRTEKSLGVAWEGNNDPLLHLNALDVSLDFGFSQSPQKLQEAEREKKQELQEQSAAAEKREQDRKQQLAQRIEIPVPELKPLEFGMLKAEASRRLKTITGVTQCVDSADNSSIDCKMQIAAGNGYVSLSFDEGYLADVTVTVQTSPHPAFSVEAAQPDAVRLLQYMQRQFGNPTFDIGDGDKNLDGKAATEALLLAQLRRPGRVEVSLKPPENTGSKQIAVFGVVVREQNNAHLTPWFSSSLNVRRTRKFW